LGTFVVVAVAGCGGGDACPSLPVDMQSLVAHAASVEFAVYDATASCDGNDVAVGASAPLVERQLTGTSGTTVMLPAGNYVFVLHAFDADGALLGSGCSAEVFTAGQRACLDINVTEPLTGGHGTGGGAGIGGGGAGGGGGGVVGGGDMGAGGGGGTSGGVPFVAQPSGTSTNLFQVWWARPGELFVVGVQGTILHSTNGGTSWSAQTSGTTQDLEAIWGSSANDVYVVGKGATMLHSANAGASWQKVTLPESPTVGLWDIWGAGAADIYVVGDKSQVLHGSGTSWSVVNIGNQGTYINDVWGSSSSDVYLFGGNGLIMHGAASGGFTNQSSGTTDAMMYGWGSADGNDVWINTKNSTNTTNTILHTANHGTSWTPQLSVAADVEAMWSMADGHGFAVGDSVMETKDHGVTWTTAGNPPARLFGVGGDPSGSDGVWAVGAGGTIFHRP